MLFHNQVFRACPTMLEEVRLVTDSREKTDSQKSLAKCEHLYIQYRYHRTGKVRRYSNGKSLGSLSG